MRSLFFLTVLSALVLGGCGKQPPAPANEPSAAPTIGTAAPLEGKADPFLTQQLRAFVQQKGRLPADFAELARTSLDSRPRPPAGMKWAIDPTSQEVKAVKQ